MREMNQQGEALSQPPAIPLWVDSHCHLNYKGLIEEQAAVIERARRADVACMLTINTKLREYDQIVSIIEQYDDIYGTVGIHPHEAENEPDIAVDALISRSKHPKIVGLGETGLDYYYENAPRQAQKINFRAHIHAAQKTGLPVIIHTRDADEDCAAILKEEMAKAPFKAVIHCFTAGPELAATALGLGFYISISGIVTFKNAEALRQIVKSLPLERLLVETDAPFLAPLPYRGKVCEPAYVRDTARYIADLRGMDPEGLARATGQNFFRLFDKAKPPAAFADDIFRPKTDGPAKEATENV